jgi:hypothetical protein
MRNRQLVALGILWLALSAAALVYELERQPQIVVQWETETEINTAGFNLYRSDSPDGQLERLNEEPILSRGDPLTGAEYEFTDVHVRRNQVYYYQLEELEVDGVANRLDTIRAEAQGVQVWVVVLAGLGMLVGAYLFIMGVVARRPARTAKGAGEEGAEANDERDSRSDAQP